MENELLTLHEYPSSHLGFIVLPVARSLVFCVMICRLLFGLFVLCGGPLNCLFFFELRIIITHLVSSNCSYTLYEYR
jgi:hypothetical protein